MQIKHITSRLGIDALLARLTPQQRQKLGEVVRFGIVGVLATLLQYAIYTVLLLWCSPSLSMTVGYILSFIFNFIASTRFTFKVETNARHGAGFALSHVVNYLLQMATLNFFLWIGVSKTLAPIPMFCICVPVNFVLVRFFLKK
ncbi:MAG: GtrA family protein [Prevotellaceae bacterium]|nr:GtrA family protein [Prevotella sp.]MCI7787749.1 GtrA family protein [Prevotella sp.]MDD5877201.1 GtrA family protein [Prevotellaceae bacterium]MDD7420736.1 GtrA family protein [Prevotellaceae bacterium]MDY5946817.1 GtrA family protein [Prevotella sp.]